jgi:hypothetical protein
MTSDEGADKIFPLVAAFHLCVKSYIYQTYISGGLTMAS